MDAYSSYYIQIANARLDDLRREAAEYALAREARQGRPSLAARVAARLRPRRRPVTEPVVPMPLPPPAAGSELRRSA